MSCPRINNCFFDSIVESENKRHMNKYKQENDILIDIISHISDLIVLSDMSGKRLFVNDAHERILGYDKQVLENGNIFDLAHPDDTKILPLKFKEITSNGKNSAEFRYRHVFGNYIWLNCDGRLIYDENGTPEKILFVSRDITKQKNALEELNRSEKQFRSLVENLNEGVWHADKDLTLIYVNRRIADMLGYSVEEMTGKKVTYFKPDSSSESTETRMQKRLCGVSEQYEADLVRKDGKIIHVLVAASPVPDVDGGYCGSIAGILDITEKNKKNVK